MLSRISVLLLLVFALSSKAQEIANIQSVNFIQDGEVSKLIIDFDREFVAERVHIKEDKQILLDIKNTRAAKKFMRGIDTSEFSGATVFVSPYKKPGTANDIRFAIQLRDNIRSFIERKKNRLILHIENRFGVFTRAKLKKAEEGQVVEDKLELNESKILIPKSNSVDDILENLTQSGVKRYVGRKISLNVNSVSYPEVLKMIGDTSGFNIIIEEEVKALKPLTINLTNLPWDQVLDTIMDLGGLVAVKYGNILTIKTEEKARAERQKELDEKSQSKTLEPLVTRIFPLSFVQEANIQTILQSYITKDRGSIQVDTRTKNLIVRDTVDVIEKIKRIIETLDTQTPQILIEAKIVEASENYELRAGLAAPGVSFSYDPFTAGLSSTSASGAFTFNTAPTTAAASPLSANISVGRLQNLAFNLELMESESRGKIVSSPKVITENGQAATISNTTQRSFQAQVPQPNGIVQQQLQQLTATVNLSVTPNVTNEGSIAMQVNVTKSGFGTPTSQGELPPTTNRTVTTNVLVDNGSTVVIGGIYETDDQEIVNGIPFLKDLPIIGWLFRSGYNPRRTRTELIIFITPRIINQDEAGLTNRQLGDDLGV